MPDVETSRAPVEDTTIAGVDWDAIERDPAYHELLAMRRRYIVPAAIVCFAAYFGFLVLAVNAPHALGSRISGGFTVGHLLMGCIFLVVWAVVWGYTRVATRQWDPQAARVIAAAEAAGAIDRTPESPSRAPGVEQVVPVGEISDAAPTSSRARREPAR